MYFVSWIIAGLVIGWSARKILKGKGTVRSWTLAWESVQQ